MKTSLKEAREFGRQRGWTLRKSAFAVIQLAHRSKKKGFSRTVIDRNSSYTDHPYYYEENGTPIAMGCHLYSVPDDLQEIAHSLGLNVRIVSGQESFYSNKTTTVIYTSIEGEITPGNIKPFLPEVGTKTAITYCLDRIDQDNQYRMDEDICQGLTLAEIKGALLAGLNEYYERRKKQP
jgi:hypothetical protein